MHRYWYVELLIKVVLFSCAFSQNSFNRRMIYVIPRDHDSLMSCPVHHCYRLQDVISKWSYFANSNTTLELLPGTYNITEKIGQLILVNVENFTLKGSSPNITITCQRGASLGLTIVQSENIEISNIQVSNCSAKLQFKESISKGNLERLEEYSEYNLSACDTNINSHPACYTFLNSIVNKHVIIYGITIIYSKGVGIFSLDNINLDISRTLLAYNQMNCINFMRLDTTSTNFSMSHSQIKFGQIESQFASGLNLFVYLNKETHNISLTNITLANNKGTHGNFYMVVHSRSDSEGSTINVNILITNISSIQKIERRASPGMVIKYTINLENKNPHTFPYNYGECIPQAYIFVDINPNCHPWFNLWIIDQYSLALENPRPSKHVRILLQNSHFIGSCVIIKDSESSIEWSWFRFEMNNIMISESRCQAALSIVNSEIYNYVRLSDLTIINSHNNILLVNILSRYLMSKLMLTGYTSFISNQGSVSLLNGVIEFDGFVLISGNTAQKHESVLQIGDSCHVYFKGEIMFKSNSGRQGGAISAYSSNVHFEGNVTFAGNSAFNGGAISLKEGAVINLEEDTHIIFIANAAIMYGGAIYVEDAEFWASRKIKCFVHIDEEDNDEDGHYNVEFENNTAGIAGAALFGGWIELCGTSNGISPINIFHFKAEKSIASHPTRVCMCTNSTLNKHKSEYDVKVFPGQTFEIDIVAVGQRFGVVPASVRAETLGSNVTVIDQLQKLQDTEIQCTKLKYTVRSSNKNETMLLSIDGQISPTWINEGIGIPDELLQFKIFISLKDCPLGFEFDTKRNTCSCQPHLDAYGVQCNFTSYKLNRIAQQWIGVLNPTKTIVIHQHCPYDYCKPYALSLNLSTPDEQCSSNRSGILCGACQPGLSQVLGTSNCKKCSNLWLILIFVFALAGVLLIAGLIKLNITVSMGTINGLIFYANIVRANTATFFPDKTTNTFLSWFIAWLNLDVGIETCFYDGLDAYIKTWLQFAYPLYIWFLVTVIIISSKYSKRAARLFGLNAVQVLATLFLLSYAKLLRLTIIIFQPTHLLDNHKVWHYDGNIAYLGKQHMILMVTALLFFVIFFIPYTLILFGIQWLQMFSHYKPFHWVNKLKPLFDAYTGPYKDRHRYWTGLLLQVRIGLFIVFSTNTSGDPAVNLLAIIIVVICLFVYLAAFGGVYKNLVLNLLEYSSLLNLVILSVATLYTISTNEVTVVLSQVSVSITLCTTVLIVVYHGLVVVVKVDTKFRAIWRRNKKPRETTNETQQCNATVNPPVTCTVIELTEPLLEC